jgi:hypothetical protein
MAPSKYKGEIAVWKEKVSNELLSARQEREERALKQSMRVGLVLSSIDV